MGMYPKFVKKFYAINLVSNILFYGIPIYFIIRIYEMLPKKIYLLPIIIPSLFFLYLVLVMLCVGFAKLFLPEIREGKFNMKTHKKELSIWLFHTGYHNIIAATSLINVIHQMPFFKLYYKLQGLKCHGDFVLFRKSDILDPYLLELGDNVIIGGGAFITSHYVNDGFIYIKRIKIGNNVTIGAHAKINPGVIIEDNAVIGENSVVLPDTHIKKNEFWAGTPAKKIKKIR